MKLTDTILEKMSNVFKPQRKFVTILLTSIILMRGKVNFRNLSRYSEPSEKTFSRQFRIPFDFAEFNSIGITMTVDSHTSVIAATDCSFISKSGKHTYGLAKFHNGSRPEAEKGLGISLLAVADVVYDSLLYFNNFFKCRRILQSNQTPSGN